MKTTIFAAVFCVLGAVGAAAQEAEIRDTISRQFEAFRQDDFARAFEFASPSLQNFFRSPENFGRMVTQGYPMVWRPEGVRFLELREEGGSWRQLVQITDTGGRLHILEYRMLSGPDGWRIGGVQILDAGGASV